MVKAILKEVQTASFVPSPRLSSTPSLHLRHSLPSSNPGWSPWNKSYRLFQPALDPLDDPGWIPICPPWPGVELKRRSSATHSNPFSSPAPRVFHLQPQGLCIQRENTFSSPVVVQIKPGSGQSCHNRRNNGTKWGYPDPLPFWLLVSPFYRFCPLFLLYFYCPYCRLYDLSR